MFCCGVSGSLKLTEDKPAAGRRWLCSVIGRWRRVEVERDCSRGDEGVVDDDVEIRDNSDRLGGGRSTDDAAADEEEEAALLVHFEGPARGARFSGLEAAARPRKLDDDNSTDLLDRAAMLERMSRKDVVCRRGRCGEI